MGKREIGTSLKLDGEAQFKAAITNINQELRVLSSEMGAAVSSFDKSGASISDLKAKGDIYGKQLDSQKEKLSVLQSAVETAREAQAKAAQTAAEMAEKYGANSDEAKKASEAVATVTKKLNDYQIQANNTTKNINQLEAAQRSNNEQIEKLQNARLEKLTEEFKKVASEAGKAASATAKIAAKSLTTGIDAGVKSLTAYTGAVTAAATAVYNLSAKSAAMADDINTLSKTTGISTEQLQIMSLYSNQVDVSVETTAKALQKLTVNMGNAAEGSSTAIAKFEALGLSVTDATGNLRSNDEVFAEAIAKLSEIENETERDAIAMDLFGKSAQDLNPLILGGADALKEFGESAKQNGMILSQEELDGLNAFNDSIDNLKTNTSAAGNILAGVFAPQFQVFTDAIGGNAVGIITSIADIFSGEAIDGTSLTEKLNELGAEISAGLEEMLPTFLSGFNTIVLSVVQSISDSLPTAVNSILPAIINGCTSLVSGLVQKIPSFVPTILKGAVTLFKGILDGLNQVIAQITPMLPQIVSDISSTLVENIPALISGAAQFFAGIVTAIAEVIPLIIAAVVEIVPLICNSIIENIPLLIDAGLQFFVSLTEALPDAIVQIVAALPEIINGIISALLEAVPQIIQAGIDLLVALIGALPEIITTIVEALPKIITGIVTAIAGAIPQLIKAGIDLFLGLIGALPDIIIAIVNALPQITDGIINGLIEAAPQLALAGIDLFIAIISDLPKIIIGIVSAIPKIITGIIDGFKENFSKMNQIGSDIMAGIGDGIISGVTAVKEKISAAGEKIMNAFKEFFDIHSPSRKLKKEVGLNLADGVGIGFTEQMSKISADMQKAVPTHFDLDVEVDSAATARKRHMANGGSDRGGFSYTQIINSPKALDTATINRQTRQGLQLAAVIR